MNLPFLTPRVRQVAYIVFAILGIAIGATQVAFATAAVVAPVWLAVTIAVYAFVGGQMGFTAADRVPAAPLPDVPADAIEPVPADDGAQLDDTEAPVDNPDVVAVG